MISVGHRAELFDATAAEAALTSDELAVKAGLDERYVRELLNALTFGGIVTYDPAHPRYGRPAEHATALTRDAVALDAVGERLANQAAFGAAVLSPCPPCTLVAFRSSNYYPT